MSSKLFAIFCLLCSVLGVHAQVNKVAINTSSANEVLDVNGTMRVRYLPPDGATTGIYTRHDGTVSTAADQPFSAVAQVVVNNNSVLGLGTATLPQFFYMPSIVLPITPAAAAAVGYVTYDGGNDTFTAELYTIYSQQYKLIYTNTFKSPGAGDLPTTTSNKLAYFITYFDKDVYTNVAVNNNGRLTYKVVPNSIKTNKTFMNIVLKPISL